MIRSNGGSEQQRNWGSIFLYFPWIFILDNIKQPSIISAPPFLFLCRWILFFFLFLKLSEHLSSWFSRVCLLSIGLPAFNTRLRLPYLFCFLIGTPPIVWKYPSHLPWAKMTLDSAIIPRWSTLIKLNLAKARKFHAVT